MDHKKALIKFLSQWCGGGNYLFEIYCDNAVSERRCLLVFEITIGVLRSADLDFDIRFAVHIRSNRFRCKWSTLHDLMRDNDLEKAMNDPVIMHLVLDEMYQPVSNQYWDSTGISICWKWWMNIFLPFCWGKIMMFICWFLWY